MVRCHACFLLLHKWHTRMWHVVPFKLWMICTVPKDISLYVTGFWKTNRIVTLGLFHFIGPANGYTCTLHMHSTITRLGWLVCFSTVSFTDPVNSWLRQWDPWKALHGRHGCEIHPSNREMSVDAIQACLCLWLALLGPMASPNGPNGGFAPPPASHPPPPPAPALLMLTHPYNVPSVILQWFWKKLLKIQQC